MRNENAAFWRAAAQSLPAHAQARYAAYFATAQQWELALDGAIEFGARLKHRVTRLFQTQAA
jgi:hypothetical protein